MMLLFRLRPIITKLHLMEMITTVCVASFQDPQLQNSQSCDVSINQSAQIR